MGAGQRWSDVRRSQSVIPTQISVPGRPFNYKAALFNGIRAVAFEKVAQGFAAPFVLFVGPLGQLRVLPLTANDQALNGCSLALTADSLYVATSAGAQCKVTRYAVDYSVLFTPPSAPLTFIRSDLLGGSDSGPFELALMGDAVIAVVTLHSTTGFEAWRSEAVGWAVLGTFNIGASEPIHMMSVAVHPVDGALWVFMTTDGGARIDAGKCVLSGGALTVTPLLRWINNDSLNGVHKFGAMVPYTEVCAMQANAVGQQIILSYNNNPGVNPATGTTLPVLTGVAVDGTPSLILQGAEGTVASFNTMGVISTPNGPGLVYPTVSASPLLKVATSSGVSQASTLQPYVQTPLPWSYCATRNEVFASDSQGRLNWMHDPVGPPTPIPPPATLLVSSSGNGAQLAWTAGHTLQIQDAAGNWSTIGAGSRSFPLPASLRVV